jgi:hypothetical protein
LKSSSKRSAEIVDILDDRPMKRTCLTFIDEDDMDWLKGEIGNIKQSISEIAKHLQEHA